MVRCRSRFDNDALGRMDIELRESEMRFAPEFIPDYAKRMSDIVNGYLAFIKPWEIRTKWIAFRLSDGGSDGTLYDTKRDAIRHQSDEFLCAYFCYLNCMGGVTPREAMKFMDYTRAAYNAGMRLPDPDDVNGGPDHFMSVAQHDVWTGRNARKLILPQ